MQYKVRQQGKSAFLYFEEEKIEDVRPHADGVELRLAYNPDYVGNTAYKWDERDGQHILRLSKDQALAIVEQDRAAVKWCDGNGTGCYDYGRSASPDGCVRCELLKALRRRGDYRKASAGNVPATAGRSPLLCWLLLAAVLATSWALCAWTEAAARVETLEKKIERVKP